MLGERALNSPLKFCSDLNVYQVSQILFTLKDKLAVPTPKRDQGTGGWEGSQGGAGNVISGASL